MQNASKSIADMTIPSTPSTLAFVAVVALVIGAYSAFFLRAYPDKRRSALLLVSALLAWTAGTSVLASSGALLTLRGSPQLALYLACCNGMALALALSPVGRTIVKRVPIVWLVGFQAFRLPLELVLHSWYEQGTLPVQMTFEGHNFDIFTGIAALFVAIVLSWVPLSTAAQWRWVLGFNLLGTGLLAAVVRIAVLSTPWALRSYTNDPPVQLVFHSPYTWILSVCVAGALAGHVLVFRWLWANRADKHRA